MTATIAETITKPLPKNYRRRWRRVIWRTIKSMTQMDTSMRCAGVAYFGFLSLFPAVATLVLLIGLFAQPVFLANMVDRLEGLIPEVALQVLAGQLVVLLEQPRAGLGLGLLLSLSIAIWSGSRGVAALMFATSRARAEPEKRGLVATIAISMLTTLLAGVAMIVVLALVAIVPAVFGALPWLGTNQMLLLLLRWPVLLVFGVLLIAAFYRFAPDRRAKRGRWIWPGAIIATLLWLAVCALFSFYVERIGNFEASFGSLATAIVLLLWMYNSALIVVLGATINAELERETLAERALAR
ncbi:YihY/virulence factor BrkB family protein [Devosia neptuniae]|uniref:YihY/virulence factor BrkB family protein n=1 Tax=Devosia neptuniae TaxID=191302 RepID=A0ABY6C8U8_9HYPH|nr:YihY/virulence factor BrkB family protein [Devosia neptuniae]UXN68645.1 YihY/virulence factor BrkB family protein [Devosia neptuniae]